MQLWCLKCCLKGKVWYFSWIGLISEGLHKADKNKKVEYKLDEDKTLPHLNTRNSDTAAAGRLSLLQKFEICQSTFIKDLKLWRGFRAMHVFVFFP